MSTTCRHWFGCSLVAALSLGLLGCGPAGDTRPAGGPAAAHDHDHGDHAGHEHGDAKEAPAGPADLPAGVAELRKNYEAIRDAFQANDLDKAHTPLHEVGELLEGLPALAEKAALGAAERDTAKAAIDAMFEGYGQIDGAIHAGKQPDYAAVADKLDKGMADLQAAVAGLKSP